jgi:restriction system protein
LGDFLKTKGFEVKWAGGSGDGGADLILKTNGKTTIVQCKGYAASYFVGPATIRELYGTLIDHKADQAWLVTTTGFHSGATSFARNKPIRLFTIAQILKTDDLLKLASQLPVEGSVNGKLDSKS